MKYRKKPVIIDAMQFGPIGVLRRIADEIEHWARISFPPGHIKTVETDHGIVLEIDTLEGVMRAQVGDYIIRGVKGEFYPCKPEIFAATYESAPLPAGV